MAHNNNFLLIMRHAKSEKAAIGTKDFDRPLNHHGHQQLAHIAKHINHLKLKIDYALVSPALRTQQTFEQLSSHMHHAPASIFDQRLYNAEPETLLEVLGEMNYDKNILLIGHNPSVSELFFFLSGQNYQFGTANAAILKAKKSSFMESLSPNGFEKVEILTP
ncbi:MAG: histidine phosphatase family protein [Myxococcales bacterium]|nr:histidine phosphatase family protein [Myxococcales bacterium]USN51563.1 MAG: histidine phosphatase family protein [Myxococcales bacterium]